MNDSLKHLIHALPKAELHLHIEGTLEPELMFEIARRNDIALPYASVAEVRAACDFKDLQSFLDLYYAGAAVLIRQRDFYDLTWAYLRRMRDENVRHVEIFFDPQTHTDRGVAFAEIIEGIDQALRDAREQLGISARLILCFLRHLSEEAAFEVFRQALPYRDRLAAVGLDSAELGNPPGKFVNVFAAAREAGLPAVVHAGEEGPPQYIREALDLLKARRIDHGVQCTRDPELVARLRDEQIPLTVCPLSNVKLRVFECLADHNLRELMDAGLRVTINSDDPAYFGGYLTQNFTETAAALNLERDDILTLARNAFSASFLPQAERDTHLAEIERVAARN